MRLKKSRISLIVLVFLTLISSAVFADDIQLPIPNDSFYVYDEVGVIDSDIANHIVSINEQLYEKTGAQIVVAVVNSLQNRTEQEFAVRLFREWGIGSEDKNNGILMLVAPNEQRLWIEIGYGLEGALPDGKVGEIRDKQIFPYFREGDFSLGILNGFNALLSNVLNEYDMQIDTNEVRPDSRVREEDSGFFSSIKNILLVIGIVVFLIIDNMFFRGFFTRIAFYAFMRGGFRGGSGGGRSNRGGGGSSGGGGAGGGW